jgi:hypothetical protein
MAWKVSTTRAAAHTERFEAQIDLLAGYTASLHLPSGLVVRSKSLSVRCFHKAICEVSA